jgi:peroxiredoxin
MAPLVVGTGDVRQPAAPAKQDEPVEEGESLPNGIDAVGHPAPGFSVDLVGEGRFQLLKREITLVYFGATWCGPCKRQLPEVDEVVLRHPGVRAIALALDDEASSVEAWKKAGFHLPIAWDEEHRISERYRLPSIPTVFIVDRAGVIRFVHSGYREGADAEIEKELSSLLER